ncbi:MAG: PspA/IM30 family protein [Spirochaetales bacterium]|nr:PspA/IM30 family protein [Spirochaetales bacterium]
MGIFKRLSDVVKANINDLISKAENPEKMLNQMLIDMNEHLIEAKKGVASAIADEKRLERQMKENLDNAKEWESKAMIALKAEKEDLAKQALLRKQEYLNYGNELKPQWEAQHAAVTKLKDSLKMLQQKIEEAQRKKNILIARAKRAETTKKIQETMGNMKDNNAFAVFDRMSEKVDKLESEADALTELEDLSADSSLEAQFKELESSGTNADLLLEELKAKMDKGETGDQ